jgi:spermidine synthase
MERIIHNSHNGIHPIVADEKGTIRTLRFGTNARQSCLDLNEPSRLILDYTKWMMTALLFPPQPSRFLVLGLGGGSITHFLLHHHHNCIIDSVERSQTVINLAHKHFLLPRKSNRLRIFNQDAWDFLNRKARNRSSSYHVAFVDIYEPDSMAPLFFNPDFFTSILQHLSSNGVMAVNVWNGDKKLYKRALAAILHSCKGHCLLLPVQNSSNHILLAFPNAISNTQIRKIKKKTEQHSRFYNLAFDTYLKKIRRPGYLPLIHFFTGLA